MDYSKLHAFEDYNLPSLTYQYTYSSLFLISSSPVNEKRAAKKNFSGMTEGINMEEAEANTDHPENEIEVIFSRFQEEYNC